MKNITERLEKIIITYIEQLRQINENDFSEKPVAYKWCRKEELGHLIDSAPNNLLRFIVAQQEMQPKIGYDKNIWNRA